MENYVYSPATNSFYPLFLQPDYEQAGSWPTDGVEVDEATFNTFLNVPPGKVRVAGVDGFPVWKDIPPLTEQQLKIQVEQERQSRLEFAYSKTADWRTELTLGIITDADKKALTVWMEYIRTLKGLDLSDGEFTVWPALPL